MGDLTDLLADVESEQSRLDATSTDSHDVRAAIEKVERLVIPEDGEGLADFIEQVGAARDDLEVIRDAIYDEVGILEAMMNSAEEALDALQEAA